MQHPKYYKIIILSSLTLCLLSCSSNSDNGISSDSPKKYEILLSSQKIMTVLSIKENNDTVYLEQSIRELSPFTMPYRIKNKINVDGEIVNDTIYAPVRYGTTITKELKIPLEQTMSQYVKKVITDQLKIENLLKHPITEDETGSSISISIFSENKNLHISFLSLSKYKDLSLEFEYFIDSLINQDVKFKEYLDEKYFFDIK